MKPSPPNTRAPTTTNHDTTANPMRRPSSPTAQPAASAAYAAAPEPDTPVMRRNLKSSGEVENAAVPIPPLLHPPLEAPAVAAPLLSLFEPPPTPITSTMTKCNDIDHDSDGECANDNDSDNDNDDSRLLFTRSTTERRGNKSPKPRPKLPTAENMSTSPQLQLQSQSQFLWNLFQPPPPASNDEHSALLGTNIAAYETAYTTATTIASTGTPYVDTERVFSMYKQSSSGKCQSSTANTLTANHTTQTRAKRVVSYLQSLAREHLTVTTLAGSVMFLFYHVVFTMAVASAILRPHGSHPILGVMVQMVSLGILFAGPLSIYRLGSDIPAVYPSVDCFLAPFLARAAVQLDDIISNTTATNNNTQDDDVVFLASFAVLTAMGMFFAGSFLLAASTFKLANLGSFLPYPVLCGFFSAVGVLLWALGFQIDNGGQSWQSVLFSGNWTHIMRACMHHGPSVVVGLAMNILGPKHPGYVPLLILTTIVGFYTVMAVTGTTLEQAHQQGWFWGKQDLKYERSPNAPVWAPPMPMGHIVSVISGTVHWNAVGQGITEMALLAFLYLLRSSIHASALKKNVANLVLKVPIPHDNNNHTSTTATINGGTNSQHGHFKTPSLADTISTRLSLVAETMDTTKLPRMPSRSGMSHKRQISDSIDVEAVLEMAARGNGKASNSTRAEGYYEIRPKTPRRTLENIFMEYGYTLYTVALMGGFGICPTVATSNTMYAIGAGGPAPQYGSILLLLLFYFTDFDAIRFIPKTVFSSLLVLGAIDTFVIWFFLAFRKTQDILEWLVVPLIVVFSLVVGFLNAVFLGIGISMFVFVSSFFRVGVVKYSASGLELRSTIERPVKQADYLDSHGDLIQILVLQNYLFFGNATSILAYCSTMFEDIDEEDYGELKFDVPPKPQLLVIDMSLVTGMDTSGFDIFADLRATCVNNQCKIFFCGLSPRIRKGLALSGVKPETGAQEKRWVRFFTDCDAALGKAEDMITRDMANNNTDGIGPVLSTLPFNTIRKTSAHSLSGFQIALKEIDEQHGQHFAQGLAELEAYVTPLNLDAGDRLFECDGGLVTDENRGLFFIEAGMLNIQRDTGDTLGQGRSTISRSRNNLLTLNRRHARLGTVGRNAAAIKATARVVDCQSFRLARFGPGWIVGDIELTSGLRNRGVHIAVNPCRLHHLSPTKIDRLETENPLLVLRLYKMVSYLMAHRQETTIGQVATLKTIMSAPAHTKPVSRAARLALAKLR